MKRDEIVNHYYGLWHVRHVLGTGDYTYLDLIEFAHSVSDLHALAILVSNYDGQVCNGGHEGYFGNGYADRGGGAFTDHPGTHLHDLMLATLQYHGLTEHPVYHVMSLFSVSPESDCEDCSGTGQFTEVDDDGDYYEEMCYACGGSGVTDHPSLSFNADAADALYYSLRDAWLVYFDASLKWSTVRALPERIS